ncbi:MAG: HypC/HybG/HupF family hydrogenase formation chaperone [Lachnospiraceae bacterium]|nr:HypC/HybG/HupF family hydrogenase formation chaperone [Lachnospiraceae bacterium]
MCVANTGKVVSINKEKNTASVDFHGSIIEARTGLMDVEEGELVLVHAGCILQKVSDERYNEWIKLAEEMGEE